MTRLSMVAILISALLVGCGRDDVAAEELAARRTFLEGNAAFARSEEAERTSKDAGADPTTLDFAIVRAEDAVAFWRKAAVTRDDWPEARRNIERGLLLLKRLRAAQADKNKKPDSKPTESPDATPVPPPDTTPLVPPPPPPPPPPTSSDGTEIPKPEASTPDLTPEQVMKLLDVLREKEKQKVVVRRADRRARSIDVEKDW